MTTLAPEAKTLIGILAAAGIAIIAILLMNSDPKPVYMRPIDERAISELNAENILPKLSTSTRIHKLEQLCKIDPFSKIYWDEDHADVRGVARKLSLSPFDAQGIAMIASRVNFCE